MSASVHFFFSLPCGNLFRHGYPCRTLFHHDYLFCLSPTGRASLHGMIGARHIEHPMVAPMNGIVPLLATAPAGAGPFSVSRP